MTEEQKPVTHLELPGIKIPVSVWNVLAVALAVGLTWWFTKQSNEKYLQALNETQTAQFQVLKNEIAQLRGNVLTQADLEKKVKETMGPEFVKFVSKQSGELTNLAVAIGELKGDVKNLRPPTGGTKTETGGFNDVILTQNRTIPLTSIKLAYDPKLPGFSGLTGNWTNNTEKFTAAYGEWRTEHDGSRAAVKLKREVFGPDGGKVGEEEVPLVSGDAYFSTPSIARTAPTPKYTFMAGLSYDTTTGKRSLAGLIGTQMTPTWGMATGYTNHGWTVLSTYRFGQKQ